MDHPAHEGNVVDFFREWGEIPSRMPMNYSRDRGRRIVNQTFIPIPYTSKHPLSFSIGFLDSMAEMKIVAFLSVV